MLKIPCEANPEMWFAETSELMQEAKQACDFCPVRAECAELGETEEFGIWGGLDPEDRRAIQRERAIKREAHLAAQVRLMTSQGMSISAMSRQLGIPRTTLAVRVRRLTALAA